MTLVLALTFGLFGLVVGSFLNVVVLRHHTGRTIMGRSGCLTCGAPLKTLSLVPVFSWAFQRGRCASCGANISVQYPLVEFATALLFALVGAAQLPLIVTALALPFISLFICIVAYDMRHTIIPDEWAYAAAALALALELASYTPVSVTDWLVTLIAGPTVALPLAALWFGTRGRGIGLGDAKLALSSGWLLGITYGLYAEMLAFVLGALVAVFVLLPSAYYRRALASCGLVRRASAASFTMKSEVPFGPFVAAGILYVWFTLIFGLPLPLVP